MELPCARSDAQRRLRRRSDLSRHKRREQRADRHNVPGIRVADHTRVARAAVPAD
jgi:hypothetical protein